jgi:hypothetical protein
VEQDFEAINITVERIGFLDRYTKEAIINGARRKAHGASLFPAVNPLLDK